jgi:hypothetical protein
MQLFHGTLFSYLQSNFKEPYALLFPRRLESVQKIMKIASKYKVGIMNEGFR